MAWKAAAKDFYCPRRPNSATISAWCRKLPWRPTACEAGFADLRVKQVIVLLDACRNDPMAGRSSAPNYLTEAYKCDLKHRLAVLATRCFRSAARVRWE